jgi:hypothetical protein
VMAEKSKTHTPAVVVFTRSPPAPGAFIFGGFAPGGFAPKSERTPCTKDARRAIMRHHDEDHTSTYKKDKCRSRTI